MEKLELKNTRETPAINFNAETGILTIEGRSLPENAYEFYKPAVKWLTAYSKSPLKKSHLILSMDYLNSGSLKQIFRLLYIMEDLVELGFDSKITWNYKKNDILMYEKGAEFQQFLDVLVELEEI